MDSDPYCPLQRLSLGLLIVSPAADRQAVPSALKPDMTLPACNPGAQEVETGGSEVQDPLQEYSKLETSQASVRLCLKNKTQLK